MSVEPKYKCKQVELYSVAMYAQQSFAENQAGFESFKPKYQDPYRTDFQTLIDTAINLPDFQTRDARTEAGRILLKETAKQVTDNWQALKRYIRDVDAWESIQKPMLEAAGSEEYPKAAAANWEYVALLGQKARLFMDDHLAELQADGNMPASFVTDFESDLTDYMSGYNDLADGGQDNEQARQAKVEANNALFDEIMGMFDDGAFIYRDNPALKKRFIFAQVLNRIRKPSVSNTPPPAPVEGFGSVNGTVTRSDTGMPLAMAEVTIAALGVVAQTDINGNYTLDNVPAGNHTAMGWHEDMESLEKQVTVMADAGVTVDFNLQPLAE
jgi:hypothetical protein